MKKVLLSVIVALIVAATTTIAILALSREGPRLIEVGTFITVALTLIALVFYANDTNILTRLAKSRWDRESVLSTTYEMVGTNDNGGNGVILFRLHNPSTLIVRAKVWAEFKVYGAAVKALDAYSGTEVWLLFPQQIHQGWYQISDLVTQMGKTTSQMVSEATPQNATGQLTLDLTIEYRDELDQERRLPTRRHYFDFKKWTWIPILTEKDPMLWKE